MRFFQEIQIAPTCFLWEAHYWLAFGRVPTLLDDSYGGDIRADPSTFIDFDILPHNREPLFLSASEFAYFHPAGDYEGYCDCHWEGSKACDFTESVLESQDRFDHTAFYFGESETLREFHKPAISALTDASVCLLGRLKDGSLKAVGYQMSESRINFGDEEVEVLPSDWTVEGTTLHLSDLRTAFVRIGAIQLETSALVKKLPSLTSGEPNVRLITRGDFGCADGAPNAPRTSPRGRKPILTKYEKKAVENEFNARISRQIASGEAVKKEADYQAVRDFIFSEMGHVVGRNYAQRLLAPIYETFSI